MKGGDVEKEEEGGDGGPLGGADGNSGGKVGGALEHQGTGSFQLEGAYPVDHIGGPVGGQESGSKGGGIDIVEARFDVQEEDRDLQSESLEGVYLVCEGEAGAGGAESTVGAALVWVEETFRFGNGRQPDRYHPFENLRDDFEEADDTEGGGGVVGGFAGFIQDHSIGGFYR